jgi:NAD(P)-dependent dehydrogenase (short-subunit alcohol dehydrogenase family)
MKIPSPPENGCAWITGASSGMGLGLAQRLAETGWRVAITARSGDKLEAAAAGSDGQIIPVVADVTDEHAMEEAAAWIETEIAPVGLAIFNAGTYSPVSAEDFSAEDVRRQMSVNYFGAVNGVGAILPGMLARGSGHIALTASPTSYRGLPRAAAYGAAKAATVSFAESMRFDMEPKGIDISVILPGFVRTPMTDQNDFEMPFLMEVEEAVDRILDGLSRRKFEIAFPKRLVWPMKITRCLPYGLYFPLIGRATGQ